MVPVLNAPPSIYPTVFTEDVPVLTKTGYPGDNGFTMLILLPNVFNESDHEFILVMDVVEPILRTFVEALDTFAVAAMFKVPRYVLELQIFAVPATSWFAILSVVFGLRFIVPSLREKEPVEAAFPMVMAPVDVMFVAMFNVPVVKAGKRLTVAVGNNESMV